MLSKEILAKPKFNNVEYDSEEELWTLLWLTELQEEGYIKHIGRSIPFCLTPSVEIKYVQEVVLKSKVKQVEKKQTILREHIYTPDFLIDWTPKGEMFVGSINDGVINKLFIGNKCKSPDDPNWVPFPVTYLEVKPIFDSQGMERLFKINQKWLFNKFGIFANLVIPQELFEKSFYPLKYLKTKTGKERKINSKLPIFTLEEYLKQLK